MCVLGVESRPMKCLERPKDPGKLVFQVLLSLQAWVLRLKLKFSAREVYVLKHRMISLALMNKYY